MLARALALSAAFMLAPVCSLAHLPNDFRPGQINVMPDGSAWVALQHDFSIVHIGRDGCYERIAVPFLEPHDPWIFQSIGGFSVGDRLFVIASSRPGSVDAYGGDPGWWSVMPGVPGHFPYRILSDGYDAWYLEPGRLEHLSGDAIDRAIAVPMTGRYMPQMARGLKNTIWVSDATSLFAVDAVSGAVTTFKPEPGRAVADLSVASDGTVWFKSGDNLGHFNNGTFTFEALPKTDSLSAFDVAPDGTVRFANSRQFFWRDRNGFHQVALDREVDAIAGTADGGAWIALDYPAAMEYLGKNGKPTIYDLYALQQASIGDHPPRRCPR